MARLVSTPARWVVLGAVAVAVGSVASRTRPFSAGSESIVSIALVGMVAALVVRWRRPTTSMVARRPPIVGGGAGQAGGQKRWVLWAVLFSAVAGWELATYLSHPRFEHPTLSVIIDGIESNPFGHGALFVAWVALGWTLATR